MSTLKPKNWAFLIPEDAAATLILYAPLHKIAVRVSPQAGDLLVPILVPIAIVKVKVLEPGPKKG